VGAGQPGSALVAVAINELVHRARPSPELVGVLSPLSDPSFPSGHVVQYTTLFRSRSSWCTCSPNARPCGRWS
jgi:membrane-associated phospholipid phosphatase